MAIPSPVTNLRALENGTGTILLEWVNPNAFPVQFTISRAPVSTSIYSIIEAATPASGTIANNIQYEDDDAGIGSDFFYSVIAYDEANPADRSAAAFVRASTSSFMDDTVVSIEVYPDAEGRGIIFRDATGVQPDVPGGYDPAFGLSTMVAHLSILDMDGQEVSRAPLPIYTNQNYEVLVKWSSFDNGDPGDGPYYARLTARRLGVTSAQGETPLLLDRAARKCLFEMAKGIANMDCSCKNYDREKFATISAMTYTVMPELLRRNRKEEAKDLFDVITREISCIC